MSSAKYDPQGVVATMPLMSQEPPQPLACTMALAVLLDGFTEDLMPLIPGGEEVTCGLLIREDDLGRRVLVLAMIHHCEAQPMRVVPHVLIHVVVRIVELLGQAVLDGGSIKTVGNAKLPPIQARTIHHFSRQLEQIVSPSADHLAYFQQPLLDYLCL